MRCVCFGFWAFRGSAAAARRPAPAFAAAPPRLRRGAARSARHDAERPIPQSEEPAAPLLPSLLPPAVAGLLATVASVWLVGRAAQRAIKGAELD
jgi:hypothetical protein